MKTWISSKDLYVLDWTAKYPHINVIEKVWAMLERAVNRNGRNYNYIDELKDLIAVQWSKSCSYLIKAL